MLRNRKSQAAGARAGSIAMMLGVAWATALAQDSGTSVQLRLLRLRAIRRAGCMAASTSLSSTRPSGRPSESLLHRRQPGTHPRLECLPVPERPERQLSSTSLLGASTSRSPATGVRRASVTANRYQEETELNNVSYALNTGLAWETINRLSGNVNLRLNRNLAAPAASGLPAAKRNIADTKGFDAVARYGGASLLTLEGRVGYSRLDYSAPEYVASESRQSSASVGLHYRPGGPLRLGVAARVDRTKTPQALFDPATSTSQPNTIKGRNLDFLADYEVTGLITANGRLSYTSRPTQHSRFRLSGLTGSIGLKLAAERKDHRPVRCGRDAGFAPTLRHSFRATRSTRSVDDDRPVRKQTA